MSYINYENIKNQGIKKDTDIKIGIFDGVEIFNSREYSFQKDSTGKIYKGIIEYNPKTSKFLMCSDDDCYFSLNTIKFI